jgi:hypothetical protein
MATASAVSSRQRSKIHLAQYAPPSARSFPLTNTSSADPISFVAGTVSVSTFLVRRDSNTASFSLSHPRKIIIRLVNL